MKKCNLLFSILPVVLLILTSGCSEMDDTYKHFLEGGKIKYAGKANDAEVIPGFNRLAVTWSRSSDPSVSRAKIYWNNRNDSVDVTIDRSQGQTIVVFEEMPEGSYSFEIITFDEEGNRSVTVETAGASYGPVYQNSLLTRIVQSTNWIEENTLSVKFAPLTDSTLVSTELLYETENGGTGSLVVTPQMDSVVLENFPRGLLKYRSTFKPHPEALDTFISRFDSTFVKGVPVERDKSTWTIVASSFDIRPGNSYRPPTNLLDNNLSTVWVNQIGTGFNYPHWVEIDMQEVYEIEGVTVQPRQNDPAARPKTTEVLTSMDGEEWMSHGNYIIENANNNQLFEFADAPVEARYFKIIFIDGYNATDANLAVAEVGAYYR